MDCEMFCGNMRGQESVEEVLLPYVCAVPLKTGIFI